MTMPQVRLIVRVVLIKAYLLLPETSTFKDKDSNNGAGDSP